MIVSGGGCRLRTTNRTTGPASFSASTARLCTTSETSTSFTRSTQSFTLWRKPEGHDTVPLPLSNSSPPVPFPPYPSSLPPPPHLRSNRRFILLAWPSSPPLHPAWLILNPASRSSYPSLPSMAAAPPGMILVIKMPGSSGTWGLSMPPAILKPRPELPCRRGWRAQSVYSENTRQGFGHPISLSVPGQILQVSMVSGWDTHQKPGNFSYCADHSGREALANPSPPQVPRPQPTRSINIC